MTVYQPREDSFLIFNNMRIPPGSEVLDMGTGTGFLAIEASKRAKSVVAVDKSIDAVEYTKNACEGLKIKNVKVIKSNLFEKVSGMFDIILFNPPYLPRGDDPRFDDDAWTGGETGREIIWEFARDAKNHLKEGGTIFLIISDLTGEKETIGMIEKMYYDVKEIANETFDMEKLLLLEIKNSDKGSDSPEHVK